ncbi:hypothetical protein F5X68DRAFT_145675, partial [Plectosphaerella plurivora]
WGTYSTTEALSAGMDLEVPGPTVWRGGALVHTVRNRKVHEAVVDTDITANDTGKSRHLICTAAADSIALLKNDNRTISLSSGKITEPTV